MTFKKFDIVLVDFPFSDLKKAKKRPALVVSSLEGENTILCQITTKRRNIERYEVSLAKESCKGDMRFDSFIYVDMLFTLHRTLIYRKIGEINNKETQKLIAQKLKLIFQ